MANETYEKLQAELSQLLNTKKYKRMTSKDKDIYKQAVLACKSVASHYAPTENTNRPTDDAKNELLAKIVNNSPTCRNCDIYRDAWNACFMASECLTNGFKFFKQRKEETEGMTKEEAIETLRANYPDKCYESLRNAVDIAIEALKAEPKHAYVIIDEDGNMECSNCGSGNCFDNYCGHCGAN